MLSQTVEVLVWADICTQSSLSSTIEIAGFMASEQHFAVEIQTRLVTYCFNEWSIFVFVLISVCTDDEDQPWAVTMVPKNQGYS
jgi:hypothetical protein